MWIIEVAQTQQGTPGFDPTATVILSATGGAIVAAIAGWIATTRQDKHEHRRWTRERRYEAFTNYLIYADDVDNLLDKFAKIPTDADGKQKIPDGLWKERKALSAKRSAAAAPLRLLGPASVNIAANAYQEKIIELDRASADRKDLGAARRRLEASMRSALPINDREASLRRRAWNWLRGRPAKP